MQGRLNILGIAAGVFGTVAPLVAFADAAESDVFAKRREWRLVGVEVPDAAMKQTMQVADPLHGPWLTLPQPDAMSVSWIARCACGGGVEYREKGGGDWLTAWEVRCGMIDRSKAVHTVRLTGLKPATDYEYRLVTTVDPGLQGATDYFDRERTVRTFRAVDPAKGTYRVFLMSDVHGCLNMNLDYMVDAAKADDCDCYFMLGDNVSDGVYMDIEHIITRGFLDDISRRWGSSKPTVILRGNHDINGRDAYKWGDYFPQPDGKTYSAFRQGPVYFVALDTMWPKPRDKSQTAQAAAYLAEQAEWLRGLKRTADWKSARFRIVMGHVAPWPCEADLVAPAFKDLLSDETPEGRIHAFVSGHHHAYHRFNPNTRELRFSNRYGDFTKGYPSAAIRKSVANIPARYPYVNLILNAHESMTLDISPEKVLFRSHRWYKSKGGLYDAFELYPDGTVKEVLDDITVLPLADISSTKTKTEKESA